MQYAPQPAQDQRYGLHASCGGFFLAVHCICLLPAPKAAGCSCCPIACLAVACAMPPLQVSSSGRLDLIPAE